MQTAKLDQRLVHVAVASKLGGLAVASAADRRVDSLPAIA
jgi:hypothetical protein